MRVMIHLDREDCEKLPYAVICETHDGAYWNTGRRRRMWNQIFTESERNRASDIFKKARSYTLYKGCPDSLVMSKETYLLWQKLGDFCASL